MDEAQKDQKLKELEKSLAQELDPSLKSMGNGGAATPPTESVPVTGASGAGGSGFSVVQGSAVPAADVISLENLESLSTTPSANAGKSITLNPDFDGSIADGATPAASAAPVDTTPRVSIGKRLARSLGWVLMSPVRFIEKSIDVIDDFRKGGGKKFVVWFKAFSISTLASLKAANVRFKKKRDLWHKWYAALALLKKLQLFALTFMVVVTLWYLKDLLTGSFHVTFDQPEFVGNFEDVATEKETFDTAEPMDRFHNPLRNPEYIVLIKRMVVTLRPGGDSGPRPMAVLELYLDASSQKTATELLDRERETRDVITRVVEEMSYDEITTESGKEKLKTLVRRDVNVVLNTGRVKRVYFKTFIYKP